jgi:hypothetical protein
MPFRGLDNSKIIPLAGACLFPVTIFDIWKKAKNADVCATLRQALHHPQVTQEWAKTPMFVPGCPRHADTRWDKNGQKRPLSFHTVSGGGTRAETMIAKNVDFCSVVFSSRTSQTEQKWAKTRKRRFLSHLVSGELTRTETKIGETQFCR